jgi:hypothetical protein
MGWRDLMDTPIVTTGVAKTDVQKPARDKPPTAATGRIEARSGEATADRAALSARSQAAAARARADDGAEAESEGARVRPGGFEPPPDGPAADRLARETSRRIVLQPMAAARAQANSDGASVLAMLQ